MVRKEILPTRFVFRSEKGQASQSDDKIPGKDRRFSQLPFKASHAGGHAPADNIQPRQLPRRSPGAPQPRSVHRDRRSTGSPRSGWRPGSGLDQGWHCQRGAARSRECRAISRPASAFPMFASVHCLPIGETTRAPLLRQRDASGISEFVLDSGYAPRRAVPIRHLRVKRDVCSSGAPRHARKAGANSSCK